VTRFPASARDVLAIALAAPFILWAVVRVAGLDRFHPVVAAVAFTPYAAAASPLPVVVALVLRRRAVAAAAAVAAVALASAVVPRALDGPQEASANDRGPTLVVMTANLYEGRADPDALLRLVREHHVDVLSLQELTPEAVRALDAAGARELLPGRAVETRPEAQGSGLMARRPLRPTGPADTTGAAQPEALVAVPGAPAVRVKAVHPRPPISSSSEPRWRREVRALPGPREDAGLRVLLGDFNGTLDHREIRRLLDRGYVDAGDATGNGLAPTWPVGRRRPGITIDHILFPATVRVRDYSVHDVRGSDHRAVIAALVLQRTK
jgi:endonuclease/exonuclease/phosphatase family metal-dependent hydrolase